MGFNDWQHSLSLATLAQAPSLQRILGNVTGRDPWFREYQGREYPFSIEVLGYAFDGTDISILWEAQRAALEEFFEHRRITWRGPRGCGKSEVLGGVAIPAFMATAPSQCLLLGPTEHQVLDNVWSKTRTTFARSRRPLPGEMHVKFWRIPADEQCFAKVLAAKTPENVRGAHAGRRPPIPADLSPEDLEVVQRAADEADKGKRRLMLAIDEANALSEQTYRVLEGMMQADNVYVWLQANPLLDAMDTEHHYVRSHHEGSRYKRIRVSALTDQEIIEIGGGPDQLEPDLSFAPVPAELTPREWIDDQCRQYDVDDPVFCADVLGRFGTGNLSSILISRRILEGALEHEPRARLDLGHGRIVEMPTFEGPSVGVDIGITHDQCAAFFMWDGEGVDYEEFLPGHGDTEAQVSIADWIIGLTRKWGDALHRARPRRWDKDTPIPGARVHVDDSGLSGVADFCAREGLYVSRVNFGAGPAGDWPELMGDVVAQNRRCEMGWACRRLLQEAIVRVPKRFARLWREAGWVRFEWKQKAQGRVLQLEAKDLIRERHGKSPDALDALFLACCQPREGPVFRSGRRR